MRFLPQALVVAALFSAIACHNVVDLTSSNFAQTVLNSEGIWMVAFVAPWCGHCQRLHPEYDKASEALGGVVNMARINCDDEKQLAQQYGIQGFPTIKVFNAGKENKKKPEDYQSHRQAKPIVDYLMNKFNSLADPVKKLTNKDDLTKFTSSTDRSKAILFSSKATNPALFKSLGVELGKSHNIDFGFVPNSNAEIKSQYDVEKEPSIIYIPAGGESVIKYDGALKKDAILKFLLKSGAKPAAEAPVKEDTTYKPRAPKPPKQVKVADVATSAHLKTECDRMCVIGFTNTEDQDKLFYDLAQKHAADSDRVRFVKLSNESARSAAKKAFELESTLEENGITVVVLRGSKLKFVSKDITESDAEAFFDRLLFGEYPLKRIDQLPTLEDSQHDDHEETSSAKSEHDEL